MYKFILAISATISFCISCSKAHKYTITIDNSINYNSIIADKLNVPFGTIVKVEGTVFKGDKLNYFGYEDKLFLKVKSVNNEKLAKTPIILFSNDISFTKNYRLLKDSMITLVVYETGRFIGNPRLSNKYYMRGGQFFHFRNELVVVDSVLYNEQPKN